MLKATNHNLKKLQSLFEDLDYIIRYEKGNFQSGYCILDNRNIIVINKFFDTAAKINCLTDILKGIAVNIEELSSKQVKFYEMVVK